MCEASVYIEREGSEELVLESVDVLEEEGDEVRMVSIFGEEKRLKARVKRLALVNHRIVLEPVEPAG
ncbi:MAG: CooT family nickel-binding protein [Deltaproteobacteria bacterium]|nr:CooT family nickel-binding protein [Deltaproteobacteria bacterium]